jgi:hypothetical protein
MSRSIKATISNRIGGQAGQATEGGTSQLVAAGKGDFGISYQEEMTTARAENIPWSRWQR